MSLKYTTWIYYFLSGGMQHISLGMLAIHSILVKKKNQSPFLLIFKIKLLSILRCSAFQGNLNLVPHTIKKNIKECRVQSPNCWYVSITE